MRSLVPLAAVVVAAVAGLAGSVVALSSRGAEAGFVYRQQHPLRLRPAAVERVVRTAPEPTAGRRQPGVAARCRPGRTRGLRNPWACSVRYRSGRTARLTVGVRDDGSYVGRYRGGTALAQGCCVALPGGR